MATSFKDYMVDLAPPWLRTAHGEAWIRAVADIKDWLLQRTKEAVKARFAALSPNDALLQLGAERGLPKAPAESFDTYRERIRGAWDTWPWAGTAKGVLFALRDAGYPGIYMRIAKDILYSLSGDDLVLDKLTSGTPPDYWASFQLFWPASAFPAAWSGTPPLVSSDEAKFILALVNKWRASHARFDRITFEGTGALWGGFSWGDGTVWGGTATIWEGPFSG